MTALEQAISDVILAFLAEEDAATPGGIYPWYKSRYLASGLGLSPHDCAIAAFARASLPSDTRFTEVGAGYGQTAILLAASGFRVTALDSTGDHIEIMGRLIQRVGQSWPEVPGRIGVGRALYPHDATERIPGTTLVFTGVSTTFSPEESKKALDTLALADGVILGLRAWFRLRDGVGEQAALLSDIQARGFGPPQDILKWADWLDGFHPDHFVYLPRQFNELPTGR